MADADKSKTKPGAGNQSFESEASAKNTSGRREENFDVDIHEADLEDSEEKILSENATGNTHVPQNADIRHGVQNLFVNNLPTDASEQTLTQLFEGHGKVLSVVIPETVSKKKARYGIVEMEDDRQAILAMEKLGGSDLNGSKITVTPALTRQEYRPSKSS